MRVANIPRHDSQTAHGIKIERQLTSKDSDTNNDVHPETNVVGSIRRLVTDTATIAVVGKAPEVGVSDETVK